MYKDYYKTKFWALSNLISSKNYKAPIGYKILYFIYYFIVISTTSLTMFNKWHSVAAILGAIVFSMNGKKYEDEELHITEYLPISYRTRVMQIYLTTYSLLPPVVILDYIVLKHNDYGSSIVEYIYLLFILIIFSNLAIIQMILTKRSFINFVVIDTLIFSSLARIGQVMINFNTKEEFVNTDFSIRSIILLIISSIVFFFISVDFIERERRLDKLSRFYSIMYKVIILIVFAIIIYQMITGYIEGFNSTFNN